MQIHGAYRLLLSGDNDRESGITMLSVCNSWLCTIRLVNQYRTAAVDEILVSLRAENVGSTLFLFLSQLYSSILWRCRKIHMRHHQPVHHCTFGAADGGNPVISLHFKCSATDCLNSSVLRMRGRRYRRRRRSGVAVVVAAVVRAVFTPNTIGTFLAFTVIIVYIVIAGVVRVQVTVIVIVIVVVIVIKICIGLSANLHFHIRAGVTQFTVTTATRPKCATLNSCSCATGTITGILVLLMKYRVPTTTAHGMSEAMRATFEELCIGVVAEAECDSGNEKRHH